MTWAKIDDRLHGHPKARRAGLEAMGLWVLALSFCGAYNTNGEIGHADIEAMAGKRTVPLANKLVEAGLWTATATGWAFHDYLGYNPSAAQVEAERARKSAGGRKGGHAKAQAKAGVTGAATADPASSELAYARPTASAGSGGTDPSSALADATASATGSALLPIPIPIPAASAAVPPRGSIDEIVRFASVLAAEGHELAKSVCDRWVAGRRPTPAQVSALLTIRNERADVDRMGEAFRAPSGASTEQAEQAPVRRERPPSTALRITAPPT